MLGNASRQMFFKLVDHPLWVTLFKLTKSQGSKRMYESGSSTGKLLRANSRSDECQPAISPLKFFTFNVSCTATVAAHVSFSRCFAPSCIMSQLASGDFHRDQFNQCWFTLPSIAFLHISIQLELMSCSVSGISPSNLTLFPSKLQSAYPRLIFWFNDSTRNHFEYISWWYLLFSAGS